jgi:hypothetical protein
MRGFLLSSDAAHRTCTVVWAEYERTIAEVGDRKAESELESRTKGVERYPIRDLSPQEQERFMKLGELPGEVRGSARRCSPRAHNRSRKRCVIGATQIGAEFEERADLSVEHRVVENYRLAYDIAARGGGRPIQKIAESHRSLSGLFEPGSVHVVHSQVKDDGT